MENLPTQWCIKYENSDLFKETIEQITKKTLTDEYKGDYLYFVENIPIKPSIAASGFSTPGVAWDIIELEELIAIVEPEEWFIRVTDECINLLREWVNIPDIKVGDLVFKSSTCRGYASAEEFSVSGNEICLKEFLIYEFGACTISEIINDNDYVYLYKKEQWLMLSAIPGINLTKQYYGPNYYSLVHGLYLTDASVISFIFFDQIILPTVIGWQLMINYPGTEALQPGHIVYTNSYCGVSLYASEYWSPVYVQKFQKGDFVRTINGEIKGVVKYSTDSKTEICLDITGKSISIPNCRLIDDLGSREYFLNPKIVLGIHTFKFDLVNQTVLVDGLITLDADLIRSSIKFINIHQNVIKSRGLIFDIVDGSSIELSLDQMNKVMDLLIFTL